MNAFPLHLLVLAAAVCVAANLLADGRVGMGGQRSVLARADKAIVYACGMIQ